MRKSARRLVLAASVALIGTGLAYAKRPIEMITVAGPGLAAPVETTDVELLALSNPWVGKFANWGTSTQGGPQDAPVYDVTLHARLRGPESRGIYQFRYAPGPNGRPGQIYLPGKGEPWYRQNVSVILREGHDGRWHAAAPEWEAHIKRALGRD